MWGHRWRAMPPGSEVWKYVTLRDDRTVVCNVCGSQLASSGSATVLRLHLQRNHRIHFTEEPDRSDLQGADGPAEKIPCAKKQSPKITKLIGIESPITHTSQSSRRISEMLRECAARLEEGEDLERHSILGVSELTEGELSPVLRSYQPASGGRSPASELSKRALPPGSQDKWQAWGFFKKLNERCVECTLCRKQLCFHNSTASLREHLRRKHRLGELERRPWPDEGSSSSESAGPEPELKKNKAVWAPEPGPPSDEVMDELLLGMVFRDLQPFSLVADEGFRRLLARLQPGYTVPSAAQLAGSLRRRYTLSKLQLEPLLRSVPSLALSTHGWSCRPGGQPYLTVTAHFIDSRWRLARCVLRTSPEPPAADHQLLCAAVADFGLASQAVVCVVHDGPRPPHCPAWRTLCCAGCSLQQCIQHGLQLEEVQLALRAARRVVSHFQRSGRAAGQRLANADPVLLLDTPSRWKTTVDMCRRLLDVRWALSAALQEEQSVDDLPQAQWELLRDLLPVLKPLSVALAFLGEEENASVSSLVPCLHGVLAQLSAQTGSLAQAVSAKIRAEIAKTWPLEGDEEMLAKPAVLASFLDPRFKDLRFLNPDTREAVHRSVKTLLAAASDEPLRTPGKLQASDYDLLFGEDPVDRMPEVQQQLESYLSEPLRKRDTDPFRWWRDNAHRFPALAGLARRYLAVPATSVSGNKPFFNCGRVPGESGAALLPEHIDQIIFLHKNFDYIELMKGLNR